MLKHGYKLIYLEKASVLVEEEQKFNVGICGCKTQISANVIVGGEAYFFTRPLPGF